MYDEVPKCVLIRSELKELVKDWAERAFRYEFFVFADGCFGCSDIMRMDFMWSRVGRISKVLGDREVVELGKFVKSTMCAESKDWDIFFSGRNEQEKAFLEECRERGYR